MVPRNRRKIDFVDIDRFKPHLYADLYIPSWVNGYSLAMEFVHNWFLSKVPKGYFKVVHIGGKHILDDLRRFCYGDLIKREKPMVSFTGTVQADFDNDNVDLHMYGIDTYVRKTDYQRSFLKDPERGVYIGISPEQMLVDFAIRCKTSTRPQQMDLYKRLELACRIGCTETFDVDLDFHVPYNLMSNLARDIKYPIDDNGVILNPYKFLSYLNKYSQLPFMYKLRNINGKREFFIRMRDIPLYMDMKNKMSIDDGEQEGQLSTSFHIDLQISVRIPVPKFYIYYNEGKLINSIHTYDQKPDDIAVYSMKLFDIPEINKKGWVQLATTNYIPEEQERIVEKINIKELFDVAPDIHTNTSMNDIIEEARKLNYPVDNFIDIQVYTNDASANGKLDISIDWKNMEMIMPPKCKYRYFYIAVYVDKLYVNDRIVELGRIYDNRMKLSDKPNKDYFKDNKDSIIFEPNKEQ